MCGGGGGGGEEGEEKEEKKKIHLESNLAEDSVSSLIFLSMYFSKTENSLDQGGTFEVFFVYLNCFFHWICF